MNKADPYLNGARWRRELCEGGGYVYCRWNARIAPGGGVVRCMDIADVHIPDKLRGRGLFTAYLQECEALAGGDFDALYVENVFNERLANFLHKRGYIAAVGSDAKAPSFFFLKT